MNEITYNEWLEKELNIYKRENKLLNDKLNNLTTMFNEVHNNELETKDNKKQILKWAYSLEKENKELKEELNTYTPNEVYKIVKENKQLKHENKTFLKQMDRQTERINQLENDLKIKTILLKTL